MKVVAMSYESTQSEPATDILEADQTSKSDVFSAGRTDQYVALETE